MAPHLTNDERMVLDLLARAWNAWLVLPSHFDKDDDEDFRRAIHLAQRVVATRIARAVDPDVWK